MEGEPRAPRDQEWPHIVEFLNGHLRPGQAWSIADEYPNAIVKTNAPNMRVIFDGDRVVSHAVLKPLLVKTPIGVLKIGGIGSVVTSTEHRGQGHSTKIIQSCLEAATAADCDIAILWTDLFDFYRRMGFELAGSEITVDLDRPLLDAAKAADPSLTKPSGPLKFLESSKVSPESILRLFNQHSVSTHRSFDDLRASLSIPQSQVATAWDLSGKMVAYAIEGKGADLGGYVHEWGGGTTALLALLEHVRSKHLQKNPTTPLRLIAPSHAQNLLRHLASVGCPQHDGFLGMMKLLKTDSLFGKIKRQARLIGVEDLVLERQTINGTTRFVFGRGSETYGTESTSDLLRLLFGPTAPSKLYNFDRATAETLDRLLPIPLWIWGWDSV